MYGGLASALHGRLALSAVLSSSTGGWAAYPAEIRMWTYKKLESMGDLLICYDFGRQLSTSNQII
jgi:hypothetical protein